MHSQQIDPERLNDPISQIDFCDEERKTEVGLSTEMPQIMEKYNTHGPTREPNSIVEYEKMH